MKINNPIKIILQLIILFCFFSCVKEPDTNEPHIINNGYNCCFILNEGRWGTDNASITKYNLDGHIITNYYFRNSNKNLILGDNANDIMLWDSLVFVSVSGTATIEVFNIYDGKSKGRIFFPNYTMPRKFAFINDTMVFVSAYVERSGTDYYVYYFNPSNLIASQDNIQNNKIKVGSHPEGICYDSVNKKLYVVNSGYGDFDCDNPIAATISVIDINTKTEIATIKTDNNPNRIYFNNNKIYVVCWGLPSDTNEIKGAIIEYEPNTMEINRKWNTNVYDLCFNKTGDILYFINSTWNSVNPKKSAAGLYSINLNELNSEPKIIISNPNEFEMWSALQINYTDNSIWIANSFKYNSDGEIMIYDGLNLRTKFAVGNIPNSIKFSYIY